MAINLKKGQTINLDKSQHDLSQITLGLGWKIRTKKKGFFSKLMSAAEPEFDLDALAFMLDENDKVTNLGYQRDLGGGRTVGLYQSDVIFYNNLRHPSGAVWHTGDERSGGAGAGADDEQIIVRLNDVPPMFKKILFLVTIYQGQKNNQNFGMVDSAFIRAVDARGKEIARYDLSADPTYNGKCSMVFGEVYRKDDGWKFRALGNASESDNFVDTLRNYLPAQ